MEPIYVFIGLMFVHWVADFVLQSDWMATNKSKATEPLMFHVGVYTLCFAIVATILVLMGYVHYKDAILWVYLNFMLHLATDFFTSRLNSWLYPRSRHYFFVAIGFDQFIHLTTLLVTLAWLTDLL